MRSADQTLTLTLGTQGARSRSRLPGAYRAVSFVSVVVLARVARGIGVALVGIVLEAALIPTAVLAAIVRVETKKVEIDVGVFELDQRIVFRARPGELNLVRITVAGTTATVVDGAGVTPRHGCHTMSATTASCALRPVGARAIVSLGDRNDVARLVGRQVVTTYQGRKVRLPVRGEFRAGAGDDVVFGGDGGLGQSEQALAGGPGDDLLVGGVGNDVFRGGSGDDRMLGRAGPDYFYEGSRRDGSDTVLGGLPGQATQDSLDFGDQVSYARRRGGVTADVDGNRDDGEGGEHDRLAGVENIQGGRGPDRLSGGRGANDLDGGPGADELSGGAGQDYLTGDSGPDVVSGGPGGDRIEGGGGDDQVLAEDGFSDDVECGFGVDTVSLDGFDFFANVFDVFPDRDAVCEHVARAGPAGMVFRGYFELARWRTRSRASYSVGCPGDGPPQCDGTMTLLRGERVLLQDSTSVANSEREIVAFEIPRELAATLPREEFRGAVMITFIDPSGVPVERRTRVTVTVARFGAQN